MSLEHILAEGEPGGHEVVLLRPLRAEHVIGITDSPSCDAQMSIISFLLRPCLTGRFHSWLSVAGEVKQSCSWAMKTLF